MLSKHIRQTAYMFITDHFGNLRYRRQPDHEALGEAVRTSARRLRGGGSRDRRRAFGGDDHGAGLRSRL